MAIRPVIEQGRALDAEAVRGLFRLRLHVQADYIRQVLIPVLRQERKRADRAGRALLGRVRRLVMRDDSLVDARDRERLRQARERHRNLATALEYRQRLQALWEQRSMESERLFEALREWCREAERSGIEALAGFARRLPAYRLPAAA